MIIDKILDRKDGEQYDAREFYNYCSSQEVGWDIADAMDEGTNADVSYEIVIYLRDNGYLPNDELLEYVLKQDWLN